MTKRKTTIIKARKTKIKLYRQPRLKNGKKNIHKAKILKQLLKKEKTQIQQSIKSSNESISQNDCNNEQKLTEEKQENKQNVDLQSTQDTKVGNEQTEEKNSIQEIQEKDFDVDVEAKDLIKPIKIKQQAKELSLLKIQQQKLKEQLRAQIKVRQEQSIKTLNENLSNIYSNIEVLKKETQEILQSSNIFEQLKRTKKIRRFQVQRVENILEDKSNKHENFDLITQKDIDLAQEKYVDIYKKLINILFQKPKIYIEDLQNDEISITNIGVIKLIQDGSFNIYWKEMQFWISNNQFKCVFDKQNQVKKQILIKGFLWNINQKLKQYINKKVKFDDQFLFYTQGDIDSILNKPKTLKISKSCKKFQLATQDFENQKDIDLQFNKAYKLIQATKHQKLNKEGKEILQKYLKYKEQLLSNEKLADFQKIKNKLQIILELKQFLICYFEKRKITNIYYKKLIKYIQENTLFAKFSMEELEGYIQDLIKQEKLFQKVQQYNGDFLRYIKNTQLDLQVNFYLNVIIHCSKLSPTISQLLQNPQFY